MRPIPLVSGWNLLPFLDFLHGIGAPAERWLAEAGILPELLDEPARPFPLARMLDFVEHAARAEGAESLGVDVGRHSAAEYLGAYGARLARCVTLFDRIVVSSELLSRSNNCQSLWLERDGPNVRVHSRIECPGEPGLRHADDFTLMLMLEAVGRAAGPGWKPHAIYLPGERSRRFARDELFQGVQMVYGSANVTIVFPSDLLGCMLEPLPAVARSERCVPVEQLDDEEIPRDFVGSLEDTIASLLPLGCPSLHDVAEIAGTTPRTLQRRLAACGSSLRQAVDRARFRIARGYLRESSATVTEIALTLGYSDSTAFSRAFHRMAGVAPSVFRERRLDA